MTALDPLPDRPPAGEPPPPHVARLVLLGDPVAHSLSPTFQNAALQAAGLPQRYEALNVSAGALDRALDGLVASRAAGNVTVPHKEAVAARCDRLTALARRVGAVNTFWVAADGGLVGDNTDVGGFDRAVRALVARGGAGTGAGPTEAPLPAEAIVAVLGAGGSARAVLVALAGWPDVRVRLWARTPARASALAQAAGLPVAVVDSPAACVAEAALVVNATPLGLRPDDPWPVDPALLAPGARAFDLVYRQGGTPWVHACRQAGHPAADGLGMLIGQGALAFARWFGQPPDEEAMWRAVGGRPAP